MPEVDLLEVAVIGRRGAGTLRAVIDHPAGVDHDLCARVTRVLGDAGMLDRFSVEVSSPGPEPPLRTTEHFRRFLGRRVRVRTRDAIEGRRSFTGTLTGADDRSVCVDSGDEEFAIPLDEVHRSNLVPDLSEAKPS